MKTAPETIAVKAVNQYRRRDIIGYLGLRLYLDNSCAQRNLWSHNVACRITLHSPSLYHSSSHFKEQDADTGDIRHRRICVPTPNEILAETALLVELSSTSCLKNTSSYSYKLADARDRVGIFAPYFLGFRERHRAIAQAAKSHNGNVVLYTDIHRYYPSIRAELARKVWSEVAKSVNLSQRFRDLGNKLLDNQSTACSRDENGLLTGPMFSHFIANRVLFDVDKRMEELLPNGYFRYVDDIALVGPKNQVLDAEKQLEKLLSDLGLSMNKDKRLLISSSHWLEGEHDFSGDPNKVSWKTFIGKMKQLLIARPKLTNSITNLLTDNGFRLKPLDYSDVVKEQQYQSRLLLLLKNNWFRESVRNTTPELICKEGLELRARYQESLFVNANGADQLEGYNRKRRIYQLRRYASRLIYLADPGELRNIVQALEQIPEMRLFTEIFRAIDSHDASRVVQYGANAAHGLAQALLSSKMSVSCSTQNWTDAARQAYSILVAHGLCVEGNKPENPSDMECFCDWDKYSHDIRETPDSYFNEISCLHGFGSRRRHEDCLLRAFDANEDIINDIESVLEQSY